MLYHLKRIQLLTFQFQLSTEISHTLGDGGLLNVKVVRLLQFICQELQSTLCLHQHSHTNPTMKLIIQIDIQTVIHSIIQFSKFVKTSFQ